MKDDGKSKKQEKILIKDCKDFRFYAAYTAYSKAWDETLDEEARLELNRILRSLEEKEVDYSKFYHVIDQYRKNMQKIRRPMFKAKKKRAWRKSEAKKTRMARHKK